MAFEEFFSRDTEGSYERAMGSSIPSGGQSQRVICFIFPAHGVPKLIQCHPDYKMKGSKQTGVQKKKKNEKQASKQTGVQLPIGDRPVCAAQKGTVFQPF